MSAQEYCDVCPAGRYLTDNGTNPSFHDSITRCLACPAGTYLRDNGKNYLLHDEYEDCNVCPAGKYIAKEGSQHCDNCSVGRYIADAANNKTRHDQHDDCIVCPSGFYASKLGTSQCERCGIGKYLEYDNREDYVQFHTSEAFCLVCKIGKFSTNQNASSCLDCPTGTYLEDDSSNASKHDSANDCIKCPTMTYNPYTASGNHLLCMSCSSGKVSTEGSETCHECHPGKFANTSSATCENCTFGRYAEISGSTACVSCLAGYHVQNQHRSCVQCDAGTTSNIESETCEYCREGKYSSTGSSICHDCESGKFAPSRGAAICDKCTTEMGSGYTSGTGASECDIASPNYYMDSNMISRICPHGFQCPQGSTISTLIVDKGHYRFSVSSVHSYRCKHIPNCLGGHHNTTPCSTGSSGFLCDSCDSGFYMKQQDSQQGCVVCSNINLKWVIIVIILVGLPISLAFYFRKRIFIFLLINQKRIDQICQRATVVFITCQSISILQTNHTELGGQAIDKPYDDFLQVLKFFTFDLLEAIPLDCVFETRLTHFEFLVFETLLPTTLLFLGKLYLWISRNTSQEDFMANFMTMMTIILPVISKRICNTFRCVTYDGGESNEIVLLGLDTNIDCTTTTYKWMKLYSIFMLFIFPLGTPLVLVLMLWRYKFILYPPEIRNKTLSEREFIVTRSSDKKINDAPITKFAMMYRPRFYWFDGWSLLRRLALTNAPVVCHTIGQTTTFTFVIACSTLIFERECQPYISDFLCRFTYLMLWEILLFIFYMLLLDSKMTSGVGSTIISSILLVMNAFIIVVVFWDNR